MATPLSGLSGSATYACGYTSLIRGWTLGVNAAPQDLTALNPAYSHQVLASTGLLKGAAGSYECKLAVGPLADHNAGAGQYDTFPEEWSFTQAAEAREVTPFKAQWRTYVSGLRTSGLQMVQYIEDTQALPLAGMTATAVLTVDGARHYNVPYVVLGNDVGVDTDDVERRVVTSGSAISAPQSVGGLPLAATECVIKLYAMPGGRRYEGTALVTGVSVSVNRALSVGSIAVAFVINGTLVGY